LEGRSPTQQNKKPSRSEKDLKGFIISAKPYLTEGIFGEAYLGTDVFQRSPISAKPYLSEAYLGEAYLGEAYLGAAVFQRSSISPKAYFSISTSSPTFLK
jgi:hypothetical protein